MKRAGAALALAACLAVPASPLAKGSVIFDEYPDVQKVGSAMKFTLMTFRQREGIRPLVTFRNAKTRQVVRVRTTPTDLNGIAYGAVRLPSTGPWQTVISHGGPPMEPGEPVEFRVGVGLTQTIPSADHEKAATRAPAPAERGDPGAGLWVWLTSAGAIGSALLVFVMRRRGRWGAA